MKLLEKGNQQKGWAKKFRCTGHGNGGGGCEALLLVEQEDVFRTFRHYYDGSRESYNTFKCSECGVLTDFLMSLPFTPPRLSDTSF